VSTQFCGISTARAARLPLEAVVLADPFTACAILSTAHAQVLAGKPVPFYLADTTATNALLRASYAELAVFAVYALMVSIGHDAIDL